MTKVLPYVMERQIHTQWCWSAVSVSTDNFYGGGSWTQCRLANTILRSRDCCSTPCPKKCNQPRKLSEGLTAVGHLASAKPGPESYAAIQSEINLDRPLCARIEWEEGAHAVAVIGYEENDDDTYLHIEDPSLGSSVVSADEFTRRYQGSGTWSFTYFTK